MKKSKIFIPLISLGALSATIAPLLTMTSCSEQGLTDTEKTIVSKINECVATASSKLRTTHQAVVLANNYLGIDASTYKFKNSKYYFAFDVDKKCFVVMSGNNLVLGPTSDYSLPENNLTSIFKFVNPSTFDPNSKYSQYLTYSNDYESSYTIKTGVDLGYNRTIQSLTYECDPLIEKNIVLNTYCDVVTITGGKDTIKHYGMANNIYVKSSNHYYEIGEAAYLSIETNSTINLGYVDEKTMCDVDIVEVKTSGSKLASKEAGAHVGASIGEYLMAPDGTTPIANYNLKPTMKTITTAAELKKAFTTETTGGFADGFGFMRLANSIDLDEQIKFTLSNSDTTSRLLILDLNGNTINDTATGLANGEALIKIEDSTTSVSHIPLCLNILDTQRKENGIVLKNHNISVSGKACGAVVALDGAKVNYQCTTQFAGKSAAFVIGYDADNETDINYSYLYVYGGAITATKTQTAGDNASASGVIYRSKGTTVQTNYGVIYGESACFVGDESKSTYTGAKLEISGGTVISNSLCVYNPLNCMVDIYGGYLQADSCVGMKNGDLTITGGYLFSNGQYKKTTQSLDRGIDINGSVILFDGNKAASIMPTIRVSNATLESVNGNIISGCMSEAFLSSYLSVSFTSGTYYWHENQYDMGYLSTTGCCDVSIGPDSIWIKK